MSNFRGIWIALVTPMRANEIDFAALEKLVKKLLEDGVAGFVVCGTTGEAAALSKAEQLAVLDAVLAWVEPGRVVMGLSGYNLRELLAFQAEVQQRDIGGLLVPAVLHPPFAGRSRSLLRHCGRCRPRASDRVRHSLSHGRAHRA